MLSLAKRNNGERDKNGGNGQRSRISGDPQLISADIQLMRALGLKIARQGSEERVLRCDGYGNLYQLDSVASRNMLKLAQK